MFARPHVVDHSDEFVAVDQGNGHGASEAFGIVGKPSRRDEDPSRCALGGDDAVKFSHHFHSDVPDKPLLTLHQHDFVVTSQAQIDSAVRAGSPDVLDIVTLT